MNDNNLVILIELLRNISGYKGKIDLQTRISEDIKIEGDDVSEFLELYSKKFNVDISGFIYDDYFTTEGFNIFSYIRNIFSNKKYKSLTINDLLNGITLGKLS